MKILTGAIVALLALTTGAMASEPIEGTWYRASTDTIVTFQNEGGQFCGILQNGTYKGQSIGCMTGTGENYKGSLTDVAAQKTYTGRAKVTGDSMKLVGCVAAIFCKGETWTRQ